MGWADASDLVAEGTKTTSAPYDYAKCKEFKQDQMTDIAGNVYFKMGDFSDNSFGCYSTGAAWSLTLLACAYLLASRTRNKNGLDLCNPGLQHTRWFLVWGLLMSSLSTAAGAYFHAVETGTADHKHDSIWFLSILALAMHCSCFTTSVVAMHQIGEIGLFRRLLYFAALLSGVFFIYTVLQAGLDYAAAFSLGSLGPLLFVTGGILLHGVKFWAWRDTGFALLGCAINITGISMQAATAVACAHPCPKDCPFPVPGFNHNAMFHVMSIISLFPTLTGLLGICYELESPDGMPYFNLFDRATPRGTNVLHRGKHTKGVPNDYSNPSEVAHLVRPDRQDALYHQPGSPAWPGRS